MDVVKKKCGVECEAYKEEARWHDDDAETPEEERRNQPEKGYCTRYNKLVSP